MTKTLYIHIGHYKTGTSAIQAFMSKNTGPLARLGIRYPEEGRSHAKHSALAFAIYRAAGVKTLMHGYRNAVRPETIWDEIVAGALADRAATTVISSEEFMRLGAHPEAINIMRGLAARPRPGLDVRIIAWLRAPDAHLRSWYNQLIKMKITIPDFNTTVCRVMEPVHYDYALALRPWIDSFGAESVQIRPYHDGLRQGHGIYEDFLLALGEDLRGKLDRWWTPGNDPNPRLDDRLLELIRVMQAQGMSEDDITWACNRMLKRFDAELGQATAQELSFEDVTKVAAQGMGYLDGLPGSHIDTSLFRQDMPRENDPLQGELNIMLGLLMDDMQRLRERSHHRMAELSQRIDALEKRRKPK